MKSPSVATYLLFVAGGTEVAALVASRGYRIAPPNGPKLKDLSWEGFPDYIKCRSPAGDSETFGFMLQQGANNVYHHPNDGYDYWRWGGKGYIAHADPDSVVSFQFNVDDSKKTAPHTKFIYVAGSSTKLGVSKTFDRGIDDDAENTYRSLAKTFTSNCRQGRLYCHHGWLLMETPID